MTEPVAGATVRFETRAYDDPLVRELVAVLQEDFVGRYGGPDAAVVDPAQFAPPGGTFVMGFAGDDGAAVAMGGFRDIGGGDAELKRMWVHPARRGRGYARVTLARLEAAAGGLGYRRLVLNTGPEQPEAIGLYTSAGYTPITPFGHYRDVVGALFFGRALRAGA